MRQRKKTQRIEYVESDSDSDGSLWDTISEVAPNAAVLLCLPKQASENNNGECQNLLKKTILNSFHCNY